MQSPKHSLHLWISNQNPVFEQYNSLQSPQFPQLANIQNHRHFRHVTHEVAADKWMLLSWIDFAASQLG
jgi:hypothetical protein